MGYQPGYQFSQTQKQPLAQQAGKHLQRVLVEKARNLDEFQGSTRRSRLDLPDEGVGTLELAGELPLSKASRLSGLDDRRDQRSMLRVPKVLQRLPPNWRQLHNHGFFVPPFWSHAKMWAESRTCPCRREGKHRTVVLHCC